jgi:hypothetical protein
VLRPVALFFAIGGSAFAVGHRLGVAQPKCANGAVKGFAYVKGDPNKVIHNLPQTFTSDPKVFGAAFNCTGRPVQVRREGNLFQIRFPGTAGRLAIATGAGPEAGQFWATASPTARGRSRVRAQLDRTTSGRRASSSSSCSDLACVGGGRSPPPTPPSWAGGARIALWLADAARRAS